MNKNLTCMVNEFLYESIIAQGLNNSNICLISKKDKLIKTIQFQPIIMCNVSYKIVSKVLCQRTKKILPECISKTQSTFVVSRQITNNVDSLKGL